MVYGVPGCGSPEPPAVPPSSLGPSPPSQLAPPLNSSRTREQSALQRGGVQRTGTPSQWMSSCTVASSPAASRDAAWFCEVPATLCNYCRAAIAAARRGRSGPRRRAIGVARMHTEPSDEASASDGRSTRWRAAPSCRPGGVGTGAAAWASGPAPLTGNCTHALEWQRYAAYEIKSVASVALARVIR